MRSILRALLLLSATLSGTALAQTASRDISGATIQAAAARPAERLQVEHGTANARLARLDADMLRDAEVGAPATPKPADIRRGRTAPAASFPAPSTGPTYSGRLYQLHQNGRIWRATGIACGNGCPGWRMLDNNPATKAISAAGDALYQLHNTGKIWRYTGAPCSGGSCPGWQMLDNNPASRALAGDGNRLFQLHSTGKIWISTGKPCSGNSCPGWTMIDDNPATQAITGPKP